MLTPRFLAAALLAASVPASAQVNVLTYRNDNMRTGQNVSETVLTPANTNFNTFGKLFSYPVDGHVDAQPLIVSGLVIPNKGAHNVVFAATEHDSLYAFDAATGATYWQVTMLKPGETTSDARSCNQVSPEIGITATPAIDLNAGPHGTIYVVAMSKDSSGNYHQRLHALDITTGAEQFAGPVDIQATYPGTGDNSSGGNVVFDPKQYKERTGLLIVNGVLYTSWASHCDIRPYTGWTMGYNETTLAQTSVFNFTPNGNEGAIWGAGGGAAADTSGNLYFQIANGTFDTTLNTSGFPSKGDFGNAFVKLAPGSGVLTPTDYWTMDNTTAESNADEDLGSGGVLILPDVVDSMGRTRHLGTGAGKDANVYVFDRDNMGKYDSVNNSTLYQELASGLSGGEFASPAWFNGNLYYGGSGDVIRSFKMTNALLAASPSSTSSHSFAYPGTSPSVSANGNSNAILWAVENTNPAVLHAYDATDLVTELYNSSQAPSSRDQFGAGNKFITPTIADGEVFVGTPNSVAVFGLLAPALTSVSPNSGSQGAAVNVTLSGSGFSAGSTVSVSGAGVTVSNVDVVNATTITATFTLAANAAAGARNVTVTTASGTSGSVTFTVNASSSAPTLTSVTPNSGAQGAAVNVTLAGTNFVSGASVTVSGSGVSVSNVTVVNATQMTATFTIAANATTGALNVSVTTSAGTSNTTAFTVNASSSAPTLTSIAPNSGAQGAAVNVSLTGTNFVSGASINVSGTGITVSNVAVVSATQITATLAIASSAAAGARTVSVTTSAGTSNTVGFTVTGTGSPAPTLASISPNTGAQGANVNVTLTGTNFVSGANILIGGGSGISVSNIVVVSATEITARFAIGYTATTGALTVAVRTAAGTSATQTFTVTFSPYPSGWQLEYQAASLPETSSGAQPQAISGGVLFPATQSGNSITFTANVNKPGLYDVRTNVQTSNAYGMYQLSVNGSSGGAVLDEYSSSAGSRALDSGTVNITAAGSVTFQYTVTGKNAASSGYGITIDSILLTAH